MECFQPASVVRNQYQIRHWKKDGVVETKVLDIVVYPDDTVLRVLMKIAHAMGKTSLPYAWQKSSPLLFTPNGPWIGNGYNANPFKASNFDAASSEPNLSFNFQQLVTNGTLNITFREDVEKELQNSYYFPDLKVKLLSKISLAREDAILSGIWHPVQDLVPVQQCAYTHVEYHGSLNTDLVVSDVFNKMRATKTIPFVQWVDDKSRVLYKLYDNHSIPPVILQQWMQHDRLPTANGALIFYSTFNNTFVRCFIDVSKTIQIIYHVDAREKLDLDVISSDNKKLMQYISSILDTKVTVTMTNISMRTTIAKSNVTMKAVAGVIGTLLPVFHIVQLASNSLDIIYKRSSNYNTIDVTETIRTLLQYGSMTPAEVAERLVHTYGFTMSEAASYIDQASSLQDVATNKKIETGISVNISPAPLGFKVSIDHAPSLQEANCALHWVRSSIVVASKKTKPQVAQPKVAAKVPTPRQSSSTTSSSSKEESEQSLSSSLSVGGGIGNEYKGYFLNMLQKADPRIFVDSADYARKCMVTNFRQPVVLTKEEMGALEQQGYAKGIDNFMEYGSDPKKQNVYFCPRIWCPESKIPLTPEQYEQNGRKCPSGEKAIQLYDHSYWDNNPDVPHMIGFHAAKTEQGLCLPCCMKRVQDEAKFAKKLKECKVPLSLKDDETPNPKKTIAKPPSPADDKEEYYLMTQNAPLPKGRYGTVPKPLHNALFPNIAHAQCSKVLTAQECLVRKGIDHGDDSLVASISSAMGMKSKSEWVKWIRKNLDPLRFITLEHGHILSMFVSDNAFVPKEHPSLVKRWKAWVGQHSKYVDMFQLQPLLEKTDIDEDEKHILSRELAVYDAYLHFIEYLQSAEPKNPYLLYDVLKHMGVLLLLWERQDNENAYLYCPLYTRVDELLGALAVSQKAIMLMKDGDFYEPLELKQRNKQGVETIPFTKAERMLDMLHACNPDDDNMKHVIANLISFDMWIDEALTIPSTFRINTLVISSDLKIAFGITKSNILIKMPYGGIPIGYLDRIMQSLQVKHIMHHDDIEGRTFTSKFVATDLHFVVEKLTSGGFGFDVGEIVKSTTYNGVPLYETLLTIPPSLTYPTIRTSVSTWNNFKDKDRRWHQVRKLVGKTVLAHHDTLVKQLESMTRKERTAVLMNTFPAVPEKDILQAVLEEMPLQYGKEAIASWMRRSGYPSQYPFLSPQVKRSGRQYIFSQVAVEQGLSRDILTPPKGPRPSHLLEPVKQQEKPMPSNVASPGMTLPLPESIQVAFESLPSKWTQIKNYQWAKFQMGRVQPYDRESAWNMFNWVATQLHLPLRKEDIEWMRNKKVGVALKNVEAMAVFLEDPSLLHQWNTIVGKKYVDGKQLIQKVFSPQIAKGDITPLVSYWRAIIDKRELWFNDIDIYEFVNCVPCSVVVLHRSPYGSGTKKRGDIADLAASSTFFTHNYTMTYVETKPLFILYKTLHDDHAEYSPIINEAKTFLYKSFLLAPNDVQELVKHHIQNKTNRMN